MVAQSLAKIDVEPSLEGEFSLAQWNRDASSNTTSRIAHDVILLGGVRKSLVSSPEIEFMPKAKKGCHGKKHASVYNILGHNPKVQVECSIHDLNIGNKNQVILKRAQKVTQDYKNLRMSFAEPKEQVGKLVEGVLSND